MVRIAGVSGGWEPSLVSILVQQREVHAHQGWWLGGDSKHWYPTENSYSYTTGWTKNYSAINTDVWFNEATSYCQVYVPGMGDSYEVNARVVVEWVVEGGFIGDWRCGLFLHSRPRIIGLS